MISLYFVLVHLFSTKHINTPFFPHSFFPIEEGEMFSVLLFFVILMVNGKQINNCNFCHPCIYVMLYFVLLGLS